jgi:glycosyltransferase involved in cell wall biosynthesis
MLGQSIMPHEVIVVDDSSTDASAAIAESFGPPVVVLHLPKNRGQAAGVAHGLSQASGDVIGFNDADDIWPRDKLALQLAALRADPSVDAVFGMSEQFVSPELNAEDTQRLAPPKTMLVGEIAQAMLVRRSAAAHVGPVDPDVKGAWFVDWLARFRGLGLRSRVLSEVVHRRRLHLTNYGRTSVAERNANMLAVLRRNIQSRRDES